MHTSRRHSTLPLVSMTMSLTKDTTQARAAAREPAAPPMASHPPSSSSLASADAAPTSPGAYSRGEPPSSRPHAHGVPGQQPPPFQVPRPQQPAAVALSKLWAAVSFISRPLWPLGRILGRWAHQLGVWTLPMVVSPSRACSSFIRHANCLSYRPLCRCAACGATNWSTHIQ